MNLRETILAEHSKAQCNLIVEWVGSSQVRFDELFRLFLHDEYRVVQRAAWPVSYCVIAHPSFIKKHWKPFIQKLQEPGVHDAVKRNGFKLLENLDIPKAYQGPLMDLCFQCLASPAEAVAIKVFALTVLTNLAKLYPEILPEIKLLVSDQLPRQTAAFRSRVKRLLPTLL
jgi:hypothetical protein